MERKGERLEIVKRGRRSNVRVDITLSKLDRDKLEAYLDHLDISSACFMRRLVQKELLEETMVYDQ